LIGEAAVGDRLGAASIDGGGAIDAADVDRLLAAAQQRGADHQAAVFEDDIPPAAGHRIECRAVVENALIGIGAADLGVDGDSAAGHVLFGRAAHERRNDLAALVT